MAIPIDRKRVIVLLGIAIFLIFFIGVNTKEFQTAAIIFGAMAFFALYGYQRGGLFG